MPPAASLPAFASGQRAYGPGLYQGKLAVFTDRSIQLWVIDPDPTAMEPDRVIDGGARATTARSPACMAICCSSASPGCARSPRLSSALLPSDVDGDCQSRATSSLSVLTRTP